MSYSARFFKSSIKAGRDVGSSISTLLREDLSPPSSDPGGGIAFLRLDLVKITADNRRDLLGRFFSVFPVAREVSPTKTFVPSAAFCA